jgi:hypothetical protein
LRNEDPNGGERYAVFEAWKTRIGVGKNRAVRTPDLIEMAAQNSELHDALVAVA